MNRLTEPNKAPIIVVDNVHKSYLMGKEAVPALRGVSLGIDKGEFICLMGPSGSESPETFSTYRRIAIKSSVVITNCLKLHKEEQVTSNNEIKEIKKMKKIETQREESQRNWKTLSEPPVGKKGQAAYFNQQFAQTFIIWRTFARWLRVEKIESIFDSGVKYFMGKPSKKS